MGRVRLLLFRLDEIKCWRIVVFRFIRPRTCRDAGILDWILMILRVEGRYEGTRFGLEDMLIVLYDTLT